MSYKNLFTTLAFLLFALGCLAQKKDIKTRIDSLLNAKTDKPFNGVIIISQNDELKYSKTFGYSNFETKETLNHFNQFVIGSISKQITAVLVLQQLDLGKLLLNVPIHEYLPELKQPWADTVTVHQLLAHTHGIVELNSPLAFKAGSKFSYSQIGYDLLAKIVEHVSKRKFEELSAELFTKCKMYNSFHPALKQHKNLVTGYTDHADGKLTVEYNTFNTFPAAGGFISSAQDLVNWNNTLYGGKLLNRTTYGVMTRKQKGAVRDHPLFGPTTYGYGMTVVDEKGKPKQYGQTGVVPGFVSMNFYFPDTRTSVVVLENVAWNAEDIVRTFYYHLQILKIYKDSRPKPPAPRR